MASPTMFTPNQLKGNWGEQYVAERLSAAGCLVRHVHQGHDSGIDLYCEKTIKGYPMLHFWVQVKTSKHAKSDDAVRRRQIRPKHKRYFLEQPIPVLLFYVEDKMDSGPKLFVRSLMHRPIGSKRIAVYSVSGKSRLRRFLDEDLLVEVVRWNIAKGIVLPIPRLKASPVEHDTYEVGLTLPHLEKLVDAIQIAMWRIHEDFIRKHLKWGTLTSRTRRSLSRWQVAENTKNLGAAIESFTHGMKTRSASIAIALGVHHELGERFEKAVKYYKRALWLLKTAPKGQTTPKDKIRIKRKVWRYLRRASRRVP